MHTESVNDDPKAADTDLNKHLENSGVPRGSAFVPVMLAGYDPIGIHRRAHRAWGSAYGWWGHR